jgi:hypothetical protein
MEFWQTIAVAVGGNAIVLAVLGWLAKSLVTGLLQKDMEQFKSALVAETESSIEKLRHQLSLVATEHQVRFSKLHETRAEVIAELYSLLVEAHWAGSSFASPMEWVGEPSKKEKYETALNASAKFYRYFEKKKIYLPKDLCDQLDAFVRDIRSKSIGLGVYFSQPGEYLPDHVEKQKVETWHNSWRHFDEQVPLAKEALEEELRSILGPTMPVIGTSYSLNPDAGNTSAA